MYNFIPGKLYRIAEFAYNREKKHFRYYHEIQEFIHPDSIEVSIEEDVIVMYIASTDNLYKTYAKVLFKVKLIIVRKSVLDEINNV